MTTEPTNPENVQTTAVAEPKPAMTFEDYKAKMAEALANDDAKAIDAINAEWNKSKAERRKAELEAERKEQEELAGVREEASKAIHKAIKALKLDDQLKSLKAWGFTYKVDGANPAEPDVKYVSVSLSTAQPKKRTGNGGGSSAGKTKDDYGLSLQEVYDKYKTAEDETKMVEAIAKDEAASEKLGKTTNSNAWRIKNEVKKRAIANGELVKVA